MTEYLKSDDPHAFDDWPPAKVEELRKMSHGYGYTKQCPVCKGHGGWNLQLNAYPLHGNPDTPAHRHMFAHFRSHCMHCNGWGWIRPDDNCPGHEWVFAKSLGRCLTLYKCAHCGVGREIDSSD